jgi:hypothetical protein
MPTTELSPPARPVEQKSPHRLDEPTDSMLGLLRVRVPEPGSSAAGVRSQDLPASEPKWGVTMMLRDLTYLLRLTRRKPGIDF